ncbi:MAG TPA: hypothetical protein VGC48_05410 [Gemmatimonadales bacterium]|jgi:hypothetical protein
MRHPLLLSLGALAALGLLIGCDESTPVSPLPAAEAAQARPWKDPVPTRTELTMVGTISY